MCEPEPLSCVRAGHYHPMGVWAVGTGQTPQGHSTHASWSPTGTLRPRTAASYVGGGNNRAVQYVSCSPSQMGTKNFPEMGSLVHLGPAERQSQRGRRAEKVAARKLGGDFGKNLQAAPPPNNADGPCSTGPDRWDVSPPHHVGLSPPPYLSSPQAFPKMFLYLCSGVNLRENLGTSAPSSLPGPFRGAPTPVHLFF